jgi:hypothetical protein
MKTVARSLLVALTLLAGGCAATTGTYLLAMNTPNAQQPSWTRSGPAAQPREAVAYDASEAPGIAGRDVTTRGIPTPQPARDPSVMSIPVPQPPIPSPPDPRGGAFPARNARW